MKLPLFAILWMAGACGLASAQCRLLTEPDSVAAVGGGHAVMTSYAHGSPEVRFYEKTSQGWQLESTARSGDHPMLFDLPIAIDGDRVVVGNCESAFLAGQAFVFERVGGRWVKSELVPTTSAQGDFFGYPVAIHGNVAVVGASHWAKGGGDQQERLHVFEFDGSAWNETAQIPAFGWTFALGRDVLAVGRGPSSYDVVSIYTRTAGQWVLTQTLQEPTGPNGPYLGSAVAIQGDVLVAGAGDATALIAGAVEIYRRTSSGWNHVQHLVPPDDFSLGYGFGRSVALSGTTLLVGQELVSLSDPEIVRVFEHTGTDFVHAGTLTPLDPADYNFGAVLAIDGQDAAISSFDWASIYRLGFAEIDSSCPGTANSTGSPGILAADGCDSVSGERLVLLASHLPPGSFTRFFFGGSTAHAPFGDGWRCAGPPLTRMAGAHADGSGRLAFGVDYGWWRGDPIAGRTWHFQAIYRDPSSSGAGFNLTNLLSIGLTP